MNTTPLKKRRRALIAVLLVGALASTACGRDDSSASPAADKSSAEHGHSGATSTKAQELRTDMRKLWEDHITWTRLFIVSAVAGLPDTDATTGRLLQNQADIGGAIAVYYGDDAGATLTELLRGHILVAADLVGAAKADETAAVERHRDTWYTNGEEIADFLAAANPAWSAEDLRPMMRGHLDQTLAEATARLTGDWAADIAEYDRIHIHILEMADILSAGIVEQFPDRFAD